ncbi:ParB/RepB/Spo0J family partition protein [Fervidobacterium sp.]
MELALIDSNPFQNRTLESRLQVDDLARSMARHGLLAPIVVYRKTEGRFGLVAGERRLRAARALGWERIPARVLPEPPSPEALLQLTLEENARRKGISVMGKLAAVLRYAALRSGLPLEEVLQAVLGLRKGQRPPQELLTSMREAAEAVGLSVSSLTPYLSPLRLLYREAPGLALLLLERPLAFGPLQDLAEKVAATPPEERPRLVVRLQALLGEAPGDFLPRLYALLGRRVPARLLEREEEREERKEVAEDQDPVHPLTRYRRSLEAVLKGSPPPSLEPLLQGAERVAREARRLRKALLGTALPMAEGRALRSEEAALLAQAGERLREVEAHLGRLRGALAALLRAALAREPDPVRLENAWAVLLEVLGRGR